MSDCVLSESFFTQITQDNFESIFATKKQDDVKLLTLHWSVGNYDQKWGPYHLNIDGNGGIWLNQEAYDVNGNFIPLSHAWHHNTANFGITTDAMFGAIEPDSTYVVKDLASPPACYGPYPVRLVQYESMAWFIAKLLKHYNLPITQVFTHYDLSIIDKYPGERWEYKFEKDLILTEVQKFLELNNAQ